MTALAGLWAFGGAADPADACGRMLDAQRCYAPDPAVRWAGGEIALGRRLARLLPEDCHDRGPVTGDDARRILVADVRLDNREALGEALGLPPGEAARLADSAILMKALERWDERAVERLAGDFAFALWDGRRERLLLARDFLGMRPLHYHEGGGFFAFASMPKGLQALPEIPASPDEEAVAEFLALMPEGEARSFFRGIGRVLPGHFMIVTRSGISSQRYWRPSTAPLRLRDGDYAEALREELDRAVAARLRGAEGKVGAHLSGGLDSGAVAATAARLLTERGHVTAFTSVPRDGYAETLLRGRFADEGPHAAAVAALYPNMEHVRIQTAGKSPLDGLDRNFFLYERPVLNLCNGVWSDAILDEAKRRRLKVMLSGQMGNMSFSYAGLELLPALLGRGRLLRLGKEAWRLWRNGLHLESVASHTVGPYLSAGLWRAINRWRGRRLDIGTYSALSPESAARLRARAKQAGLDFSYRPWRDGAAMRLWALGRVDLGNYHKGWLGGWGIDMRDPTADRRLIELCLRIPAEQYLAAGETRALARRAFADRLPPLVLKERRKGYQAADWHEALAANRAEFGAEVERLAGMAELRMVDAGKLSALIENWPEGERDWNAPALQASYRLALLRGISAGHFMRKASGSNR